MFEIIVGTQNTLTYTWTVTTGVGTLVISGCSAFDLVTNSVVRIFNTTHTGEILPSQGMTFTNAFVAGLKTFTWTFTNLPAGTVSGDTLLIYLAVDGEQIQVLQMYYQKP